MTKEIAAENKADVTHKKATNSNVWPEIGSSVFLLKFGMCATGKTPVRDGSIIAILPDHNATEEFCNMVTSCIHTSISPSVDTMQQIFHSMVNKLSGISA